MEIIKNNYKTILFTIIYAIITFLCVIHHEIWADEAQVWQIARHIQFFDLFKHLVNEGHPSLFYLLMMPFAKLGLPIFFMQVFCWLAMVGSVFLLLKYSPFNGFTKFAIITSAGFLYFFPVIARTYSTIPILVFALAIFYPKAKEHPYWFSILLVILANIHIIMFGFCSVLALYFAYENILKTKPQNKKNFFVPLVIISLGLFSVIIQLIGTTSSNAVINFDLQNLLRNFFAVICKFFIIAINADFSEFQEFFSVSITDIILILVSLILYSSLFLIIFKENKKIFSILSLSILFQLLIYVVSYNYLFVSRIFCAHIILVFGLWLILQNTENARTKKKLNILLSIFFLLTFFNGVRYCLKDYFQSYSGAKPTAKFIQSNINNENSILLMDNIPYGVALAYYLEQTHKIYSAAHKTPIKYVVWDESLHHFLSAEGWDEYVKFLMETNQSIKNKKIYAIISQYQINKLKIKEPKNFKKIYENNNEIILIGERYKIFEYIGNN